MCVGVSPTHLSHVQHLNEMKICCVETWVTSHFITVIHYPAVLPRCRGGKTGAEDKLIAVWMIGVCVREGVRSQPVNGPATVMWVSACCSFCILSRTLLASLDKQLPPSCESSSEPRTRAASLTSPGWSSTWKHTFANVSAHSVNFGKRSFPHHL